MTAQGWQFDSRTCKHLVPLLVVLISACSNHAASNAQYEDVLQTLSFRTVPDGSAERRDECACLNIDAKRIEGFTENMKYSQYSMFYLAMGREKLGDLQTRADQIGCKLETSEK